ncbi:MAG TPA: iron-containing redox enzyme family protein [Arcobacter sp.]|nr:iron-containing redox enzyme family protein [Arcobacter sp.]
MTAIKTVMKAIEEDINTLVNHPFILDLEKGKVPMSGLKIFAEQYYLISCAFNKFLFNACGSIDSEEIREPLLENLYDEHGRGNLNNSHRELLKKFLAAVDIKNIDSIKPLASTQANIYGMNFLCKNSSVLEILGALGPGCEAFTTEQYTRIYKALKKFYNFSEDDLIFFTEHIHHDPRHTSDIEEVISKAIESDHDITYVIEGAKKAIIFETLLWDGIHNQCKISKNSNKRYK